MTGDSLAQGRESRLRADLLLLFVALVWGSTFPAVKASLEFASPLVFVALRFLVASLALFVFFPRRILRGLSTTLKDGTILGFFMAGGFVTQTLGLNQTSASRSGFLTSLYVMCTPILQVLAGRGRPSLQVAAGVAVVFSGLYLLALPEGAPPSGLLATLIGGLNEGDLWTLACAVLFALNLVGMDILAPRHDAIVLTFVQLMCTALAACCLIPFLEVPRIEPGLPLLVSLLYLACFATLAAIYIQTRFQRETTPTRAGIIFSMEAVFASLLAYLFLGDRLGFNEGLGGVLIITGLLVSELSGKES